MFEFAVEPADLFAERSRQFIGWGIPEQIVERVRANVDHMWGDDPSAWVPAWGEQARAAQVRRAWLTASMCWGAARFPCLATPRQREAYRNQLDCYRRAAPKVPATFLRWVLDVPYRGQTTPVAVHVWRRPGVFGRSLLVMSGGVDTWKVELHRAALAGALLTGMTVAVLDMPGTGESEVPLACDADEILAGAVEQLADRLGARRTAFFGISFGGHWSAKLALTGRVDAAVDLGGPIGAGGSNIDLGALPNGMAGIVGNALGLSKPPSRAEVARFASEFSLRRQGLLDMPASVPLLVINGTADQYIPAEDTTAFATAPNATVWLVRGATHCAAEHITRVLPAAMTWARARLEPGSRTATNAARIAQLPLTPLLAATEEGSLRQHLGWPC